MCNLLVLLITMEPPMKGIPDKGHLLIKETFLRPKLMFTVLLLLIH